MSQSSRPSLSRRLPRSARPVGSRIATIVALLCACAVCDSNKANADWIQVTNACSEPYITSWSAVLDARHPNATIGYDPGIDNDMDTSINPFYFMNVMYAELEWNDGLHAVDCNFSNELVPGQKYKFKLSFENNYGMDLYNIPNELKLLNFTIDNSNGVTDYEYSLSVNTTGLGGEYNLFSDGLLSEVWATPDKKIAEWSQRLPAGMDWRQMRSFGELEITAIGNSYIQIPGDANHDQKVDADDAKILSQYWGQPFAFDDEGGVGVNPDFNRDGVVDARDAAILAANWGCGVGAAAESTLASSVPEATTGVLLLGLAATAATLGTSRRGRGNKG